MAKTITDTIAESITALRKQREWSVYRLSIASGVPVQTLYSAQARKGVPRLRTLEAIADGLGVPLALLMLPNSTEGCGLLVSLWHQLDVDRQLLLVGYANTLSGATVDTVA